MRKPAPRARVRHDGIDDALLRDARFVADRRLLEVVHMELERSLDGDAARAALLRLGCHHGMRNALGIAREHSPRSRRDDAPASSATPLVAMQLVSQTDEHGFVLHGTWPHRNEAEAVLAGGRATSPACFVSAGYASGWLSALGDAEILAIERSCAAAGDPCCRFEARDVASWRAIGDPAALALLARFPFESLRDAALDDLPPLPDTSAEAAFDPESPAVHVWGPVMVVPYAGEDTASTIETVVRDPGAAAVSVVVIDLAGAVVDDGFGAVALERIIDTVQGWGAEAVLTGLSPLSERVVAGLAGDPIVVPKDLRNAIATAFRIAESQRRAL